LYGIVARGGPRRTGGKGRGGLNLLSFGVCVIGVWRVGGYAVPIVGVSFVEWLGGLSSSGLKIGSAESENCGWRKMNLTFN
jgi:hypothetical protein